MQFHESVLDEGQGYEREKVDLSQPGGNAFWEGVLKKEGSYFASYPCGASYPRGASYQREGFWAN